MAIKIVVPREGQSMETAQISKWHVKVGDKVSFAQVICEAESEKASFEVESPAEGTVLEILYDENDTVPVLVPIAIVGKPGEDYSYLLETDVEKEEQQQQQPAPQPEIHKTQECPLSVSARRPISPRARKLMWDNSIEESNISGEIIRERDVISYLNNLQPLHKDSKPLSGRRAVIAKKMFTSLQTTAQLTLHFDVDVTTLLKIKSNLNSMKNSEIKITVNDLILFAVAKTLANFLNINATYSNNMLYESADVNLGCAVDTKDGLVVPVIKDAANRTLQELSAEMKNLAERARQGSLKPDEMSGGTFTVTNLGSMGISYFTPVLNIPEVAILGVGKIKIEAVRVNGNIDFVDMMNFSLTIDHQIVDGADGARFINKLTENIENYNLLFL